MKLQNGMTTTVAAGATTYPLQTSSLKQLESDLVMLDDINEGLICHTLRQRFADDAFYTAVGTILVAINPYRYLPIYTPATMKEYHRPGNKRMAPHVFQVAAAAHKAMALDNADQAILISGESGAGKTEATKHCSYLAEVAGSEQNVEAKVLQANPLLEAFGNAKTLRNNNSSRFGKFIEVHFSPPAGSRARASSSTCSKRRACPARRRASARLRLLPADAVPKYSASLQLLDAPSYRFLAGGAATRWRASTTRTTLRSCSPRSRPRLLRRRGGRGDGAGGRDPLVGNLDFARDGEGCRVAPGSAEMLAAARLWECPEAAVRRR